MNCMIPNHDATMYGNGYVWRQGVNSEATLGHRLEQRTGLRVVNLGRQGDCAFQEAYLLTEDIGVFAPRVVVHVFTPNDLEDLYAYLSDAAMEAFIAATFVNTTEFHRGPVFLPTTDTSRPRGARRLAATIAEVLAQQR
jgi:hypothetical protein